MKIVLLLLALATPSAANEFITSAELKAGETGYGLTVLQGDSIIRFPVTYIGGLENAMVDQDIVLIRLEGAPFDKTGIIQGMSGSPIYFRGRLLGALAYGWGFSRDPIAGVTPIANMLTLIDESGDPRTPVVPPGFTPAHAPLSVAGLPPSREGEAWRRINELGFLSAAGGRLKGRQTRLEPGSPIGVRLIDGDLSITAIGTVTYVRDSDVIAFGHPFLNRGISRLPMTGARIETVLPSQQISFKLGSSTDDAGSIIRDGNAGISGTFGDAPAMIPFEVYLETPWGKRDYRFRICRDDLLAEPLMELAWAMAAEAGLFTSGGAGVDVTIDAYAAGRRARVRERGVVNRSVLEMMPTLPIQMLYQNPFSRVHPDSVAIRVVVNDDRRVNEIYDIRAGQTVAAPGETVSIEVEFQTYDVGRNFRTIELVVPHGLRNGRVTIQVTGGRGLNRPDLAEPRNVAALLDRLDAYEPRDLLIVTMTSDAEGRPLETEEGILPALPPSMRALQSGRDRPAMGATLSLPMDAPIVGRASVSLEVRRAE